MLISKNPEVPLRRCAKCVFEHVYSKILLMTRKKINAPPTEKEKEKSRGSVGPSKPRTNEYRLVEKFLNSAN